MHEESIIFTLISILSSAYYADTRTHTESRPRQTHTHPYNPSLFFVQTIKTYQFKSSPTVRIKRQSWTKVCWNFLHASLAVTASLSLRIPCPHLTNQPPTCGATRTPTNHSYCLFPLIFRLENTKKKLQLK